MHLAGVVFRDEASALEQRLLGDMVTSGKTPTTAEDAQSVDSGSSAGGVSNRGISVAVPPS